LIGHLAREHLLKFQYAV